VSSSPSLAQTADSASACRRMSCCFGRSPGMPSSFLGRQSSRRTEAHPSSCSATRISRRRFQDARQMETNRQSTRSQNTKSCSAGVKLRREDFNQVRAGLLLFPHVSADFIGRAGRLARPSSGSLAVRIRGPGSTPFAIASRSGISFGAPTLCTVVKPAIRVTHAFDAA
jgi:hypothetical protein